MTPNRLILLPGRIYAPAPQPADTAILIEAGRIVALAPAADLPADAPRLDAAGLIAAPGYIDLQINGGFGHDFTADAAGIPAVAAQLPASGVTAFLPTLITAPLARHAAILRAAWPPAPAAGATILGFHCEGPYISPARPGAHPRAHILAPAGADLRPWQPLAAIRLVTLAPELPGAPALAARLQAAGVALSIGHSDASYDQARAAFDAGFHCVTHLFNAMRPLHHREPGLIGAALDDRRVRAGLIADGLHLHPAALRLAWRAKGPAGSFLVSDAMAATGKPAGVYRLGDQVVEVDAEQGARLSDGTLAGSLLTLDQAVRNLIAATDCPIEDALAAASTTPATVIGVDARKGRLAAGYDADIVLLTADLRVAATFVAGQPVFGQP